MKRIIKITGTNKDAQIIKLEVAAKIEMQVQAPDQMTQTNFNKKTEQLRDELIEVVNKYFYHSQIKIK